MRVCRALLAAALAVGLGAIGTSAASAATPLSTATQSTAATVPPTVPSLTGEEFQDSQALIYETSNDVMVACDPSGTTTLPFRVTGIVTGPYPGTITEQGLLSFGPQTNPGVNSVDPGTTGPITTFDATFTIISGTTTITGNKHFVVPGVGYGGCFDGRNVVIGNRETLAQFEFLVRPNYEATIHTALGSYGDHGVATVIGDYRRFYQDDDGDGSRETYYKNNSFAQFFYSDTTPTLLLPTSNEQCKNGGWKNYGVFKNQGDCVSYVETGGKNPPSGP
jgi:hypothetical protein